MGNDFYKTPQSEVIEQQGEENIDATTLENRNAKYILLALLLTPIATSIIYCGLGLAFNIGRSLLSGKEPPLVELDVYVGIFVISLGVSFLFSLVVGMPLNWFLIKINKLQLKYFVLVGGLLPIFLVLTASIEIDLIMAVVMLISGSISLAIFWYVAAYLPTRRRS